MPSPSIEIRQQQTLLGHQTTPGGVRLAPARVELQMETRQAKIQMESPAGELILDQSRAWDALSLGSNKRWNERLYTQIEQHVLQYISKTVTDGQRLASTAGKGINTIAQMARESFLRTGNGFEYAGHASSGNVDVDYNLRQPFIEVTEGQISINIWQKPLETEFIQSRIDLYIRQRGQVEIIPPQIELQL